MVPPLMVFLAKHPLVKQFDLSSVRLVACGAAPLSSEIVAEVQARLPTADILQAYGMTESTILMTITPPQCDRQGSVGQLVEGLQVKVCINLLRSELISSALTFIWKVHMVSLLQ